MYYQRRNTGNWIVTVGLIAVGAYLASSPTARRAVKDTVRKGCDLVTDLYQMMKVGTQSEEPIGSTMVTPANTSDRYVTLQSETPTEKEAEETLAKAEIEINRSLKEQEDSTLQSGKDQDLFGN